jgi:FkbM family methyltransferase
LFRLSRAIYRRLGLLRVGRRRARDLFDFIETRKIDVVIDVGAHTGEFGLLLRTGGYRGRIISFEPVKASFAELSAKARGDRGWEVRRCAVGRSSGQGSIQVSELSIFSSILPLSEVATLHDSRMTIDHAESVPVVTLDETLAGVAGNVLLKVDTQGYERQVLDGGRETLRWCLGVLMELPAIHIYSGDWEFHEALAYMHRAGFILAQAQPVNYHTKDRASAVDFDCLFRPRGELDPPGPTQLKH